MITPQIIEFKNIEEAWFELCHYLKNNGDEYVIERGSFKGNVRLQAPFIAFKIINQDPIHVTYKGQNITTPDEIQKYFLDYLVDASLASGEQYTYGSRIAPYLDYIASMLTKTPMTNQATIEVGKPDDILLLDPPCMRVLSWKVVEDKLQLTTFFRSWDCHQGLPTNLGGLTMLNQYMSTLTGIEVGPLVCYSDGLHIYRHSVEFI